MITVKELMNEVLYTLHPTDTVHQARQLMLDKNIRHVPVVNADGEFMGLVTKHDVLRYAVSDLTEIDLKAREEIESNIPLAEIMQTDIVIADEDTSLIESAHYMLKQRHGCLPVFRGDTLVGILTDTDFVKLALYLMERAERLEKGEKLPE